MTYESWRQMGSDLWFEKVVAICKQKLIGG